jgi:hypothetical protein
MKLCLIGSTRFKDLYHEANRKLTADGHIVYSVAFISSDGEPNEVTEAEKIILDLVHLRKILESDAVVLISDETKYIGFSTKREIQWAQMNGKHFFPNPKAVPSAFRGLERNHK